MGAPKLDSTSLIIWLKRGLGDVKLFGGVGDAALLIYREHVLRMFRIHIIPSLSGRFPLRGNRDHLFSDQIIARSILKFNYADSGFRTPGAARAATRLFVPELFPHQGDEHLVRPGEKSALLRWR